MRLDRLDKTVAVTLAIALLFIVALLLRGDRIGVQITRISPASGADDVPIRGRISLTFSEAMITATLDGKLHLEPAISGTLHWAGNTVSFVPMAPLQPNTNYTFTLQSGARSVRGRSVLQEGLLRFRTGHPRLMALMPASGIPDLFVFEVADPSQAKPAQRLTSEPYGVWDYAISPDGTRVVYSARRDESDSRDLWLINTNGSGRIQLVTCDEQACIAPAWSADGTRIAFERRNLIKGAIGKTPGPSRIWLVDPNTRDAVPLLEDSQKLGAVPRWSPVGNQLAYYDADQSVINVIDTAQLTQVQLPSVLGDPGAWSPDGRQLIYPELQAIDAGSYYQLFRADLTTSVITSVFPLSASNDSGAAWSPVGDQLAFTRRGGAVVRGPGAQIWMTSMNASATGTASTAPYTLTQDIGYTYGAVSFSPDGQWLTALRFNLSEPNAQPEVWLLRADGSDKRLIAENATQPAWLP